MMITRQVRCKKCGKMFPLTYPEKLSDIGRDVISYQLLVKIGLAAKNNFNDVESLLNRVVPQNMVVTLLQLYNTHAELGRFTHAQLAAYTHNQLRNEVLKNGE